MLLISGRPRASAPVTAVIVVPPVRSVPELVMNALVPLITQRPSRNSARVAVAPASLPAPGSVSPKPHSLLAVSERNQPAFFLLLASEQVERACAQRDMRGQRDRRRRIRTGDLHDGQRIGYVVPARAAPLFGKRQTHEAELRHLAHELVREFFVRVVGLGSRSHFFAREIAAQRLNCFLLVGQVEIHCRQGFSGASVQYSNSMSALAHAVAWEAR